MSPPPCKARPFAMDRDALRMVCSPEFWRMGVLWTLSLLYSYLLLFLRGRSATPRYRLPGPHSGYGGGRPICVVTGAAAAALARESYHVVLAGRSAQLLSETTQEIRGQQPDAYLEAFQVDLTSYKSIKKFETLLNQWIQESNLEINNAGMLAKSHRVTVDGIDECVCLLMFSYELHRQLHISSGVSVMAADPGVVETSIMRELPPCLSWFAFVVLRFLNLLQQPDTRVDAVLDAAFALPEASGKYFFGGKGRAISSSALSYDVEVARKLWAESSALFQEMQLKDYESRKLN